MNGPWFAAPQVAALYVDPDGVYAGRPDVDVWDESRDARLYAGPHPVVAHPPCNRWARLSHGARRGQDGGCFAAALASVRRFGGVLEHPAYTQAWPAFALRKPSGPWWERGMEEVGWVCSIDQWHYGFPTRKPTWLYYVGDEPPALIDRPVLATRGCENLHSGHRSRTPADFAELLLAMARGARVEMAA